jgi:hypothetical protein
MKEVIQMIKKMDMEFINGKMGQYMKDSSKTI